MPALALLIPLLAQEPSTAPDRLTLLRKGREEEVTLLHVGAERVHYVDQQGEVREAPRKGVRALAGPRIDYEDFLRGMEQAYADRAEPGAAYEFALWCRAHGFQRDVELACWRELARDPEHAGARALLGHAGGPGAWQVPLGDGRAATWPDALRLHATADLPWRFTTMHCTVEASGPLDRAVLAAAAAEYLHGRTASLLRAPAELWFLRQPLRLRIWPPASGRGPVDPTLQNGRLDLGTGVAHLRFDATDGVMRPLGLERRIAELTLLRACAEQTQSAPQVPAWLLAGLGLLLEASTDWGSGLPTCALPRIAQATVTAHATARHRLDAGQVAILAEVELDGPHGDVLRAQCATLLHFLLHLERPQDAAAFSAWLRLAVRNRGGGSALREAFGARFGALDADWRAWVDREGGPRAGERAHPASE